MEIHACLRISIRGIYLVLLCVTIVFGKPFNIDSDSDETLYKNTEEILSDWNNENSYYDYSQEVQSQQPDPNIKYLPPVLVELEQTLGTTMTSTTTTTTSSTPTTTSRPVYFPKTNIELGPLFEQVGKAKRNQQEGPVDLPVPYIVWTRDSSGSENNMNYWKRFYNTMYKVD